MTGYGWADDGERLDSDRFFDREPVRPAPKVTLQFDREINAAAAFGDNDAALEYSIDQRNFYEHLCDGGPGFDEWRRRVSESNCLTAHLRNPVERRA